MSSDRSLIVKFEGKVDPSLEQAASRTTMIATGIGSALGNLAAEGITRAGDALVGFVGGSVSAASALAEASNVTTLVFGQQADAMRGFFEGAATSIGMSEASARSASANIGGLLQNMGFANDASATWSQTLLGLAADMGSAFNKDPQQAIEAIGAGLRGESEPLKQFNVFLSDAAVKAKAMEMGLYGGKGAIDQHAKAQASLALIMEQTSKVQGDFAATAEEEANASRILAAQTEDLQAKIGTQLLPVKKELLRVVSEDIIPAFEGFVEKLADAGRWVQDNTAWLAPLAAGLLVVAGGLAAVAVQQQIVAAGGLLAWLTKAITSTGLYTAAQWLLNVALNANPIGLVILALTALGVGLAVAWAKSETFRQIVTAAWDGIKAAASGVVSWFADTAWPAVQSFIDGFAQGFDGLVGTLGRWAENVKTAVSTPIRWIGDNVLNPLMSGIEKVAGVFGLSLTLPRFADGGIVPGFAGGGYTGPGGKYQPAGIVHAGEVVWSQDDVAAWGGPTAVDELRKFRGALADSLTSPRTGDLLPGFAGGGIVPNATQGFAGYHPPALAAMQAWAAATGRTWYMTGLGGARTYAQQLALYQAYLNGTGNLAANPAKGGPHMVPAIAMDLSPRPGEVAAAKAIMGAFGLGLPVPGEPWHLQYLAGRGGSGIVFDPIQLIKDALGSIAKVSGAGVFGDMLNAVPGKLIDGAGEWIKTKLGFDAGGWLPPGEGAYYNGTGQPEAVLTTGQWDALKATATRTSSDGNLERVLGEVRDLLAAVRRDGVRADFGNVDAVTHHAMAQLEVAGQRRGF